MNEYSAAMECFVDSSKVDDYINIRGHQMTYDRLCYSLDKNFKMIMLHGKSGTGKSLLLKKLLQEHKDSTEMYYFPYPPANTEEFFQRLFKILTGQDMPQNATVDFQTFVDFLKQAKTHREIVVVLDEFQMYNSSIMNNIRLLSDSEVMKFILSMHEIEDGHMATQEHFQSRIWESHKLEQLSKNDLLYYVQKRLINMSFHDISNSIKKNEISLIHKFTKGNLREAQKLMRTILEIHEYYKSHSPSKIDRNSISRMIIEMAAIKLGYINA